MRQYPSDQAAREALCAFGRRVYERGFVAANDGNLSIRVAENAVWITPAGVSKGYMEPEMMVKLDLDGNLLAPAARGPSSESGMHLHIFRENPAAGAVVHAHPVTATAFSIVGRPLTPDILAEPLLTVGDIPVAPFAMPGTGEVAASIAGFWREHDAALLANHGALAWGADLETAFFRLDSLEHFCKIYLCAQYMIGEAHPIPPEGVKRLRAQRERLRREVFGKTAENGGGPLEKRWE